MHTPHVGTYGSRTIPPRQNLPANGPHRKFRVMVCTFQLDCEG